MCICMYSAVAICNIFASNVEPDVFGEWTNDLSISDLVVTTQLRVDSPQTKDCLGKALYNLLCPGERREAMMIKGNYAVLSTIIELTKSSSKALFELCTKVLYNLSCHIPKPNNHNYVTAFRHIQV